MFGPKTHCVVVVGAQWGDEGKGKIVDVLAERADLVVRYQGGANAGHTVDTGAGEFVLHQIPSGIIQGAVCIVGNGVVLDPETFFTELDALGSRGVRTEQRLYVSDRAHLTLPYHKLLDRARERRDQIGTTGRGIGPTYEDKYGRRGVRVGDLRNLARARGIVCQRVEAANQMLELLGSPERADAAEHVALLERLGPRLLPITLDAGRAVYEALQRGESVLLEGAQGALLDVDHGTYPYVTSSNTTAGGAAVGACGADLRDAPGVAEAAAARAPARGPAAPGAGLSRPLAGPRSRADSLRERRYPARSDHRGRVTTLDLAVIGAGPCGLAVGVAAKQQDLRAVLFDKGPLVASLLKYPTYMTFFSTPEKLEIGGVPFTTAGDKPTRREALGYYRKVAEFYALDVRLYHAVTALERVPPGFELAVRAAAHAAPARVRARHVVFATGYFDSPNPLGVPGEELPHVSHFFTEAHPYWRQSVVMVRGD